jgi:hypothetical protein
VSKFKNPLAWGIGQMIKIKEVNDLILIPFGMSNLHNLWFQTFLNGKKE